MFGRLLRTLVFTMGLVSMASAQRGGSGPRGGEEVDNYSAVAARPYSESRLDRIAEALKLNKQQKSGTKEIFDAAQKEAEPVRDEIAKGRTAITVALLSHKSDEEVDQLLGAYGTLVARMTGIELRAFAKVCEGLTPDQQKRVGPVLPI